MATHMFSSLSDTLLLCCGLEPRLVFCSLTTGWWVPLPKFPRSSHGDRAGVLFPRRHASISCLILPCCRNVRCSGGVERANVGVREWPPSLFIVHVFSMVARRWTERLLIRGGEAIGTVAEMRLDERLVHPRHAVYWRGALYVLCEKDFTVW